MSVSGRDHLASPAFRADCAAIVRALDEAQTRRNFDGPELQAAVTDCARNARVADVPPEKLIVALKVLMHDVALADMGAWYRGVLTDRVIVWAIEAFYHIEQPPPASGPPSPVDPSGGAR